MLMDSLALKVACVKLPTDAVPSNLREDTQACEWLQELVAATLL